MSLLLIPIGLMSGVVIAGGLYAFIVLIGIVPRLLQKTGTSGYILLYESVIAAGAILGTLALLWEGSLMASPWWEAGLGLLYGIFVGCLAIALAETLELLPVLRRRLRLQAALPWILIAFACGKMLGTLLQFFVPGLIPK